MATYFTLGPPGKSAKHICDVKGHRMYHMMYEMCPCMEDLMKEYQYYKLYVFYEDSGGYKEIDYARVS